MSSIESGSVSKASQLLYWRRVVEDACAGDRFAKPRADEESTAAMASDNVVDNRIVSVVFYSYEGSARLRSIALNDTIHTVCMKKRNGRSPASLKMPQNNR